MKLLILIVGLILGAGGGIFYAVQFPDQAAKIAGKENELIAQGKREAMQAIKAKLDALLTDQSQPASTNVPGSSGFAAGNITTSTPADQKAKIKSLSDDLAAQINQLPAKK